MPVHGFLVAALLSLPALLQAARPPPSPVHTVALRKQRVPVLRGGRTVANKTAYFGSVLVGSPKPQVFTVLFDTGSGHFILPSSSCASTSCAMHRRYSRDLSASARAIDYDGSPVPVGAAELDTVDISFGTGEVSGPFVEDLVCFGEEQGAQPDERTSHDGCLNLRVVTAWSMTEDPFQHFDFDGVAGLGLAALALHSNFSLVAQLTQLNPSGQTYFGVFLARGEDALSEISFGGHNPNKLNGPLAWAPVQAPELGYWQVQVREVRVGDKPVGLCADGGCTAVLDTGTSMLGVPQEAASSLHRSLARPLPRGSALSSGQDCRRFPGPPIIFDLGDVVVRLEAEDYSRPAPAVARGNQALCRASLLPVAMGAPLGAKTFVFGEPVLKRYYTAYDWKKMRIGFASAREPLASTSPTARDTLTV